MLDPLEPLQLVESETNEIMTPISRGKRPKFSQADVEALRSTDSIELVTFLDRPADRLARLLKAASEFRFELTDADREAIKQVNRDERNPERKEALKQGIRDASRKDQKQAHAADRLELVQHLKTLKAYRAAKGLLPAKLRTPAHFKAAAIKADLQVEPTRGSSARAAKKRGRPVDEGRRYLKAHRGQFGWGGRGVNRGVQSNWRDGDYSFWQSQEGAAFIGAGGFSSISLLDLQYPHSRDRQLREIDPASKKLRVEVSEFYDRRSKEQSELAKVFDDPTNLEKVENDDEIE